MANSTRNQGTGLIKGQVYGLNIYSITILLLMLMDHFKWVRGAGLKKMFIWHPNIKIYYVEMEYLLLVLVIQHHHQMVAILEQTLMEA